MNSRGVYCGVVLFLSDKCSALSRLRGLHLIEHRIFGHRTIIMAHPSSDAVQSDNDDISICFMLAPTTSKLITCILNFRYAIIIDICTPTA